MITITDTSTLQGYTGCDHLIEPEHYRDLIGQSYRDVRAVRAAVYGVRRRTQDSRCRLAPVNVEIRLSGGDVRVIRA